MFDRAKTHTVSSSCTVYFAFFFGENVKVRPVRAEPPAGHPGRAPPGGGLAGRPVLPPRVRPPYGVRRGRRPDRLGNPGRGRQCHPVSERAAIRESND